MSLKDKEKWNSKYSCDDFITGKEPSNWLESNANLLNGEGRALDIAAGEGRNSVFAASLGYEVICMDISEIALAKATVLAKENNVDIVLTGDSFTEGACVKPTDTVSAVLRKLDFNAISIGKAGNGPLIELAALKEYAEPLKPKIILWMYYMNDFVNLDKVACIIDFISFESVRSASKYSEEL